MQECSRTMIGFATAGHDGAIRDDLLSKSSLGLNDPRRPVREAAHVQVDRWGVLLDALVDHEGHTHEVVELLDVLEEVGLVEHPDVGPHLVQHHGEERRLER